MIGHWTKLVEKFVNKNRFMLDIYGAYYKEIVDTEVNLAEIRQEDNILCIGGGAIPCTAMAISERTNARINVIDIDCEAVEKSRRLLGKLGLKDRVLVDLCNGNKVDVKSYDVIHIALQVSPKDMVVKNILDNAKSGTRIIIRRPKKILRKFYSNISSDLFNNYEVEEKSLKIPGFSTMDHALVLVKN